MSGRPMRVRTQINYSVKALEGEGAVAPAWLKAQHSAAAERASPGGSAEKENPPARAKVTKPKPKPAGKDRDAAAAGKKKKSGGGGSADKAADAVASRGRNAGLRVEPIVDRPGAAAAKGKKAAPPLPKAAREVPGLPGVVQRPKQAAAAPAAAPPKQAKDKHPAAAGAGPSQKHFVRRGSGSDSGGGWSSDSGSGRKRKQQAAAAAAAEQHKRHKAAAAPAPAARPAAAPRAAAAGAAPRLDFPPLPPSGADALLAEAAAHAAELQRAHAELVDAHAALKEGRLDGDVRALLERHAADVAEHGAKAAELVEHWRAEAAHQAALADKLGGAEFVAGARRLQADLATCQAALLDAEAAVVSRDRRIAELELRAAHLERWARVPTLADKCLGTEPAGRSAGVQAPSAPPPGVELMAARALAPEGAAGGSVYRFRPAPPAAPGGEPTFSLPAQRTGVRGGTAAGGGSDMRLAGGSSGAPGWPPRPGSAAESRGGGAAAAAAARRQSMPVGAAPLAGGRRLSAPVAPGGGAPRALLFSGSGLAPVAEGDDGGGRSGAATCGTSAASLPPREAALARLTGFEATPVRGGIFVYTHRGLGFTFELGPASAVGRGDGGEAADGESGDDFDEHYRLVAAGAAEETLAAEDPDLLTDFDFQSSQRAELLDNIMRVVAKAAARLRAAR